MSAAEIDQLAQKLRPHYAHFLGARGGESLLTGHSHQAWPDVAREAQLAAWDDAARLVDGKWDAVFGEILPELQRRIADRLGSDRPSDIAIAPNTHELVYRLLSCLPADARVLTTDSEFHSLNRQLRRSEEEGLQVERVAVEPGEGFVDRMVSALEGPAAPDLVALSLVFFTTSRMVSDLPRVLEAAAARNIPVLVDVYHAYCAVPLEVRRWPGRVFVVGGGYKYAQCGEGCCFMQLPEGIEDLRPRQTGWMADFAGLSGPQTGPVGFAPGAFRFFGATFDPTPLYRAVYVLRWMDQRGLDPATLRAASLLRTERFIARLDDLRTEPRGLSIATPREADERGAFVAVRTPRALELSRSLRARGVHTDARGDLLRFGPAPYTTSAEIDRAATALSELL